MKMTLGECLIKYRNENNMTQKELSEQIKLSKPSISYIENGWVKKCSLEKLALIVKIFNLTPEELYSVVMSVIEDEKCQML